MKFKRLLLLLFALVMAFPFAACFNTDNNNGGNNNGGEQTENEITAAEMLAIFDELKEGALEWPGVKFVNTVSYGNATVIKSLIAKGEGEDYQMAMSMQNVSLPPMSAYIKDNWVYVNTTISNQTYKYKVDLGEVGEFESVESMRSLESIFSNLNIDDYGLEEKYISKVVFEEDEDGIAYTISYNDSYREDKLENILDQVEAVYYEIINLNVTTTIRVEEGAVSIVLQGSGAARPEANASKEYSFTYLLEMFDGEIDFPDFDDYIDYTHLYSGQGN